MHYILTGFRQDNAYRVFSFEGIEAGKTTTNRAIRADISLALKYNIRLQELPLLCRGLVEQALDGQMTLMTFTEENMQLHQRQCAEDRKIALARKKPAHRVTPSATPSANGWRSENINKTPPFRLYATDREAAK